MLRVLLLNVYDDADDFKGGYAQVVLTVRYDEYNTTVGSRTRKKNEGRNDRFIPMVVAIGGEKGSA
jgi:hypothetical protein